MPVLRFVAVSSLSFGGAWGAVALLGCVGADPDPTLPASEASAPAPGAASDAPTGTSPDNEGGLAAGADASEGGPTPEAGPTCGTTPATCISAFDAHRLNDCDPALQACFSGCGSTSNPCASGCKNNFVTCMQGYQTTCIDCGKGASSCDPYKDCDFSTP